MDSALFSSLLRNLLRTDITLLDSTGEELKKFEERYCYNATLQPAFTSHVLSARIEAIQEQTIYGIRDELGICILFFRAENQTFIVGPFVKEEFDIVKMQRVLIRNRMSASYIPSVKLYYSAFPIHSSYIVRQTIIGCLRTFTGCVEEISYCRLHGTQEELRFPQPSHPETLDYSTLYQRYDMENRFLRAVETGDTDNVLNAYRDMNIQGMGNNRYINAIYQDPTVALSMVRTLARKAAERGGASVIEINEITQRAAQRMYAAQDLGEHSRYAHAMIYELTDAVRRHRYQVGDYSEPIKKAAEFLSLNFSQKILLCQLADRVGLSAVYLSKAFKKEVGMTISQYITHLRCTEAAEMLRSSDIPIQEISNYVGYPDNNYFVKVFKTYHGVTPSAYRVGAKNRLPNC